MLYMGPPPAALDRKQHEVRLGLLWFAVLFAIALLQPLASSVSDFLWLAFFGITAVCAVMAYFDFGRYKNAGFLRSLLYLAVLWFCLCGPHLLPNTIPGKAKEAEVKQNLHAIQLAIEKYAAREKRYPRRSDDLLQSGDLSRMPANPFRRHTLMYETAIDGLPHPGGFNYALIGNGYKLSAFGDPRTTGSDVNGDGKGDCVILVLDSKLAQR